MSGAVGAGGPLMAVIVALLFYVFPISAAIGAWVSWKFLRIGAWKGAMIGWSGLLFLPSIIALLFLGGFSIDGSSVGLRFMLIIVPVWLVGVAVIALKARTRFSAEEN